MQPNSYKARICNAPSGHCVNYGYASISFFVIRRVLSFVVHTLIKSERSQPQSTLWSQLVSSIHFFFTFIILILNNHNKAYVNTNFGSVFRHSVFVVRCHANFCLFNSFVKVHFFSLVFVAVIRFIIFFVCDSDILLFVNVHGNQINNSFYTIYFTLFLCRSSK